MSSSTTVPCDCCKDDTDRQCYEITGWSASPIGTPGCATTAELEIVRRYIEKPAGSSPTPSEVQAAIDGAFTVDCSMEESGFCRARGADGLYPWTSAVYQSSSSSGEGAAFSYTYLFEDCKLDEADLEVTVGVRYLGLGSCPSLGLGLDAPGIEKF